MADGAAMEKAIKDLVDLGKIDRISRRSSSTSAHAAAASHTVGRAIRGEAEARELLGEKLQVTIGTGKSSFFVSVGKDSEALLKKVIDKMRRRRRCRRCSSACRCCRS